MNRKSNKIIERIILKSVSIFAKSTRHGIKNKIFIITEVAKTLGFNGSISRIIKEIKSIPNEINSLKIL